MFKFPIPGGTSFPGGGGPHSAGTPDIALQFIVRSADASFFYPESAATEKLFGQIGVRIGTQIGIPGSSVSVASAVNPSTARDGSVEVRIGIWYGPYTNEKAAIVKTPPPLATGPGTFSLTVGVSLMENLGVLALEPFSLTSFGSAEASADNLAIAAPSSDVLSSAMQVSFWSTSILSVFGSGPESGSVMLTDTFSVSAAVVSCQESLSVSKNLQNYEKAIRAKLQSANVQGPGQLLASNLPPNIQLTSSLSLSLFYTGITCNDEAVVVAGAF